MSRAERTAPKRVVSAKPDGTPAGPRRSGLLQARSRRTRQQLVDAAVRLWTERGFERGVEETTVEEIVQAAGVTKGTFYFHFAHKEDILLEVGWGTSQALYRDTERALATDRPVDEVLDELLRGLARRINTTPRAAVARTLAEFYRRSDGARALQGERFGFQLSFTAVFAHAQGSGQLPAGIDVHVMGDMLASLTVGAIHAWINETEPDLAAALCLRASVVLDGLRGAGLEDHAHAVARRIGARRSGPRTSRG